MNPLRDVRHARGLDLADFSVLTGLAVSHLSEVETGQKNLSDHGRVLVARALRLSPREARSNPELRPKELQRA